MPRSFLEIAFDGTAYAGWQVQPHSPSVQAEVERALAVALGEERVEVTGCGRTDAGVHASSFFLHFDHAGPIAEPERFTHSLNGLLPPDIAVYRLLPVPDDGHARFSAMERGYRYRIHHRKDPFLRGRSYLFRPALDVAAMTAACAPLLGRHAFTSFCRTGSDAKTMDCDLREARWEAQDHGCAFVVKADRFLRNMVRALVGTCLEVGQGQQDTGHLARVLEAQDRSTAGRSVPAEGLFLEHVRYPFIDP